jgi:hypothetical protein
MFATDESWLPFVLFVAAVCLFFPAALGLFIGAGAYMLFRYVILNLLSG